MKGILGLLRHKLPPEERKEAGESVFFSTAFADHGISADVAIPWEARAVKARPSCRPCGPATLT